MIGGKVLGGVVEARFAVLVVVETLVASVHAHGWNWGSIKLFYRG